MGSIRQSAHWGFGEKNKQFTTHVDPTPKLGQKTHIMEIYMPKPFVMDEKGWI